MALVEAQGLLAKLETSFKNGAWQECAGLISKLKVLMLSFPGLTVGGQASQQVSREVEVARATLELAMLVALQQQDAAAFDRNLAQLQVLYHDFKDKAPRSEREPLLTGLNLMRLLADSRTAEFHTALELIPVADQGHPCIRFPMEVEQWMMEGAYRKVARCGASAPDPSYAYFTGLLESTVRDEIASCCEKAFRSLTVAELARVLGVSEPDAKAIAARRGWQEGPAGYEFAATVRAGDARGPGAVPAEELIQNSLLYARELERIV
ncbi:unnamed protein product [Pedinophyceae sp. YPF-701]|nr:unnamed protein product [Pedinophyceae sp. YPF-701]